MIHLVGVLLFAGSLGISFAIKKNSKKKSVSVSEEKFQAPIPYEKDTPLAKNQDVLPCDPDQTEKKEPEEDVDFLLKVSTFGMGFAFAGNLIFPPVALLSLPLVAYSSSSVFESAYRTLREKTLRISILDSLAIFVGVIYGYYSFSAIADFLYVASMKILKETRNNAQKKFIDLFGGRPPQVWLLKDGIEISVPLEKINIGDLIVVNTGEIIPLDGIIEEGIAQIDQRLLTGEGQPEEKIAGQPVFATTLVVAGRVTVRVEKTGADTVAAHVTQTLINTDDYISLIENRSENFANQSVIPTLALGGVALLLRNPRTMLVTLSSNFSEIMRLTMPLSMLNYLHVASDAGLLIKDGRSLEQLLKVDTIVFDKTGTLTLEQPHVGNIYPIGEFSEREVLYYTAAAEYRNTHPIAQALLDAAAQQEIDLPSVDNAQYTIGYGIRVNLAGRDVCVGSARFMRRENIIVPDYLKTIEDNAYEQGYSLIYTAVDNSLCGIVELHPTLRPEAREVIQQLRQKGLAVYILSGDHIGSVKKIAMQLGVDNYIAETLPEQKSHVIEELQQSGKTVCFVGDGINDAIALKKAAISMSLQDASHIAIDSAQIVLIRRDLRQLLEAFTLAKRFNENQYFGLFAGTVIPSVICMGGAIIFSLSIPTMFSLYWTSSAIGMGSAMYPLLENKLSKKQRKSDIA